ncbi:hypothetical protein [Orlajensenia leifsoniae]|uniref:Uncharacterized protein n=1 Tax=Orlajensenia leifsoniae TaxID=2561933 RepID=A0A4Y9QN14_9MICO|nr:hypothetical protein [Leifsonia flava]TFV94061.1 hypothetical protein E4M00_17435 [Leifsonia flava]
MATEPITGRASASGRTVREWEGTMASTKALRCRFGLHKWVLRHQEETGLAYHECALCGVERSDDGPPATFHFS